MEVLSTQTLNLYGLTTGLISAVSNFFSYHHLRRTYNTELGINYLLALDSALCALLTFLCVPVFLVCLIPALGPGPIVCSLQLFLIDTIIMAQGLLGFTVALVRYKRLVLNQPNGWIADKKLKKWTKLSIGCCILYIAAIAASNSYFDLNIQHNYNYCLNNEAPKRQNFILVYILIGAPLGVLHLGTLFLDIKCALMIRNLPSGPNQNNFSHDIPMNASIISSVVILVYLVMFSILALVPLGPLTKRIIVMTLGLLPLAIRNPLIAALAIRANDVNQRINKDEERERKRQIEIREALEAREERKRQKRLLEENGCEALSIVEDLENGGSCGVDKETETPIQLGVNVKRSQSKVINEVKESKKRIAVQINNTMPIIDNCR